jgi:L-lactate dehydrogenase complex protein LldG
VSGVAATVPGSGRARVLAQIRQSLGRGGDATAGITPLPGTGPRPAFDGDIVERFVAKMLEKSATLERLAALAEVGPAVARFVAGARAGPRLRVSRALATITWPAGLDVQHGAALREDQTSVTPCFAAVAESGGIVTLSGPDTPSTLNFVPDNHIVVVHASQVLRHFEDVWAQWRASALPMPRSINIISGPSRTADIEQTIQLGAHGPRRLHILLVGS